MNCEHAKELLVDRVYGELDEAGSGALDEHLSACPACREELATLGRARSLLARGRTGEPAKAPALPAGAARASPRWARLFRLGPKGVVPAMAAAAAAALLGVTLWVLHKTSPPPAWAETGPVEIKRTGVSLTILSKPDNWHGQFRWGQREAQQYRQITMNASPYRPYSYTWPGMALVRDQRLARRLRKGKTSVRLTGVPSGILPDSVRLRGLTDPDALTILEQNYQYDLASATAVLKRHIDEQITVVFKDNGSATGKLLSFDGSTLVIQPAGEGPRNIDRAHVQAVTFEKLPRGLLTQPTLVWDLHNRAAPDQQFEVAYLTHGLNWRADYVLKLRLDQGRPAPRRAGRDPQPEIPEIFDTADIVGYATVMNQSGVTYLDAQLKLLAGDVNLIQPGREHVLLGQDQVPGEDQQDSEAPQFKEKSFFEYHLYTLGRPTTIRNAETKQIELLTGKGIRLKRGYVYDPHRGNATAVRVTSEFENSEENGLGKPLPKGIVRLYAPDPDGVQQYVSQQNIDHTPVDEDIRLLWGFAFDIAASFKQTEYRRAGYDRHRTWEYSLRNHKDYGVTIVVVAHVDKSTYKAQCNYPWHVRAAGLVEIDVPVKANQAAKVLFSHSYNRYSGGGLTSPHDKKAE